MIKAAYKIKKAFSLEFIFLGDSKVNDRYGKGAWQQAGRREAWVVSESSHVDTITMRQKEGRLGRGEY